MDFLIELEIVLIEIGFRKIGERIFLKLSKRNLTNLEVFKAKE